VQFRSVPEHTLPHREGAEAPSLRGVTPRYLRQKLE
jgi:hypothetical protein